jgi:hypothetical protein
MCHHVNLVIPVDLGCLYVCILFLLISVAIVLHTLESLVPSDPLVFVNNDDEDFDDVYQLQYLVPATV